VDPLNPAQIAEAIDYLVAHPEDAERMGRNGRKAVLKRYNWPNEEKKLFGFYERMLKTILCVSPTSINTSTRRPCLAARAHRKSLYVWNIRYCFKQPH